MDVVEDKVQGVGSQTINGNGLGMEMAARPGVEFVHGCFSNLGGGSKRGCCRG